MMTHPEWDDPLFEEAEASSLQVARFRIAHEDYGLDIMRIKEIVNTPPITRLPRAPAFVEGVVELRGEFLPVIDLRRRFGAVSSGAGARGKLIVVALEGLIVGLMVDDVLDVRRVGRDDVRPVPAVATAEARFLQGLVRGADRAMMLVDLDSILTASERRRLRGLGDET